MNKSEMARILGVSRPTVYKWEKDGILEERLKTSVLVKNPKIPKRSDHAVNCHCLSCKPKK